MIASITRRPRNPITVKRIAILGFLLALTIGLKYAFGFVPGIEMVSFMFIICGLFLPILDLSLLVVCFNLLVLALYGFGGWWFVYWIIWPLDAFISKGLSKITKNRFVFGVWGFIAGFSVAFYYFFSDWAFFGHEFATLNIITAVPVNLIEGFTTMFLVITIGPKLMKVIGQSYGTFWDSKPFEFAPVKNKYVNWFASGLIVLSSIAGVVLLFIFNHIFLDIKEQKIRQTNQPQIIKDNGGVPPGWGHMSVDEYNNLYNSLGEDQVGIAIIANGKVYTEAVDIYSGDTVYDAMERMNDYEFQYYNDKFLGAFVEEFRPTGTSQWLHGTGTDRAYNHYHLMYMINHKYADLGVSNLTTQDHDIYELVYDYKLF